MSRVQNLNLSFKIELLGKLLKIPRFRHMSQTNYIRIWSWDPGNSPFLSSWDDIMWSHRFLFAAIFSGVQTLVLGAGCRDQSLILTLLLPISLFLGSGPNLMHSNPWWFTIASILCTSPRHVWDPMVTTPDYRFANSPYSNWLVNRRDSSQVV